MAKKTILVGVGPAGEIEIEAVGFKDESCLKETADIAEALGVVTRVVKKPEAQRKAKKAVKRGRKAVALGFPSGLCG